MDEDHYVLQYEEHPNVWTNIACSKFYYTSEESEAKALRDVENLLHIKSVLFDAMNFRIIQVKVVMFVPRKG